MPTSYSPHSGTKVTDTESLLKREGTVVYSIVTKSLASTHLYRLLNFKCLKMLSIELDLAESGIIKKAFFKGRGAEIFIFSFDPHTVKALQRFRATSYRCRQLGT
jgi:hypothetical protein